jgi:hypothetical protein
LVICRFFHHLVCGRGEFSVDLLGPRAVNNSGTAARKSDGLGVGS